MPMNTGTYISGAGHLLLIAWVLLGGLFSAPRNEPLEVTDVTILSGEEFAALTAPAAAPRAPAQAVETPRVPEMPASPRPAPAPEREPERPAPPPPQETPAPDPAPDTSAIQPPPDAAVEETVPPLPAPPQVTEAPEAPVLDTAPPRPAPRVAPEAAPAPPEDVAIAEQPSQATRPAETAEPEPAPETEPAAPEEATTQIVTEAEQRPETGMAMASSPRPKARPSRPAPSPQPAAQPAPPAEIAEAPAEDPEPAPEPEAPSEDALADAVAGAVADAMSGTPAEEPRAGSGTAASGPPMTAGERDALRVSVAKCWNVGSLSTEAMRTQVVVGVDMQENGRPVTDSIRLLSWEGGSETAARQTYESARRAIIRCGSSGFPLPVEKYGHWREIEMTFNPENMRIR